MKGGKSTKKMLKDGFTIIETLLFVAISGVLFITAISVMSAKQQQTEFSTGVGSFTSRLQTIINNVSSGYYNLPSNVSCSSGSRPNISTPKVLTTSNTTGTNVGCIFLGDVLAFGNNTSGNSYYTVYPVIGNQFLSGSNNIDTVNLAQARPTTTSTLALTHNLYGALNIAFVQYINGGSKTPIGAFGILTNFKSYIGNNTANGQLQSGSQSFNLDPIPSTSLMTSPAGGVSSDINSLTDSCGSSEVNYVCFRSTSHNSAAPINPSGGIEICLNNMINNNQSVQSALITIGGPSSGSIVSSRYYGSSGCK